MLPAVIAPATRPTGRFQRRDGNRPVGKTSAKPGRISDGQWTEQEHGTGERTSWGLKHELSTHAVPERRRSKEGTAGKEDCGDPAGAGAAREEETDRDVTQGDDGKPDD
jgi:hypothetical protein